MTYLVLQFNLLSLRRRLNTFLMMPAEGSIFLECEENHQDKFLSQVSSVFAKLYCLFHSLCPHSLNIHHSLVSSEAKLALSIGIQRVSSSHYPRLCVDTRVCVCVCIMGA